MNAKRLGTVYEAGATRLVMFTGIMNAKRLGTDYEAGLVFIQEAIPG